MSGGTKRKEPDGESPLCVGFDKFVDALDEWMLDVPHSDNDMYAVAKAQPDGFGKDLYFMERWTLRGMYSRKSPYDPWVRSTCEDIADWRRPNGCPISEDFASTIGTFSDPLPRELEDLLPLAVKFMTHPDNRGKLVHDRAILSAMEHYVEYIQCKENGKDEEEEEEEEPPAYPGWVWIAAARHFVNRVFPPRAEAKDEPASQAPTESDEDEGREEASMRPKKKFPRKQLAVKRMGEARQSPSS